MATISVGLEPFGVVDYLVNSYKLNASVEFNYIVIRINLQPSRPMVEMSNTTGDLIKDTI